MPLSLGLLALAALTSAITIFHFALTRELSLARQLILYAALTVLTGAAHELFV